MDAEFSVAQSHLKLCRLALNQRLKTLEARTSKQSRHYNRLKHTRSMLVLLMELEGMVMQDPDLWDDEPDLVPF